MDGLPELMSKMAHADFLHHFKNKTRWRSRVDVFDRVKGMLTWPALDSLLGARTFPTEKLRIVVDERRVDSSLYVDAKSGSLRDGAVPTLAAQGATLVIDGISRMIEPLADLSRGIERELGGRVNCSAYISFGARSAFLPHYDDHDVLVVHLLGSKRWRGYGQGAVRFPVRRGPNQQVAAPEWEDVLEPGDLLYLPRGEVHAAVPVERPSLHLTFGIGERYGVDFVKALARAAEDHEVFRHSLSRTAVTAQEAALKQALHALVDAASLKDFLDRDDQERRLKPTAAFNVAARLAPDTVLASTLLRRLDLQTDDPRERKLVLGGRSLRLTALERRALDHLTARDSATLAALADALGLPALDQTLVQALASLATNALVEIRDQD